MSSRDDTLPEGLAIGTDELPAPPIEAGVLIVDEAGARRIVELAPGRMAIGAGSSADLQVAGRGVEEEHLLLEPAPGGMRAEARGLVFRNGRRLVQGLLASGDRVRLGTVVVRYVARGDIVLLPALATERRPGLLWWASSGWAIGYLAALVVVVTGLAAPAATGGDAAPGGPAIPRSGREGYEPMEVGRPLPPAPLADADGTDHAPEGDDSPRSGAAILEMPAMGAGPAGGPAEEADETPQGQEGAAARHPTAAAAQPVPRPSAKRGSATSDESGVRIAALPRRTEAPRRAKRPAPPQERRIDRMWAAWEAGAFDDLAAAGWGASDLEMRRLALLGERFARALADARSARGVAAVPALERALGFAEEIGRDAPHVREVRHALAAHHRGAARRAEEQGDLRGAVHHCEQALAVLPQDGEARALRTRLGARSRQLYLEGYALQHLNPPGALRLAELAALVASPGDPAGEKAAALAARLREEVGGPGGRSRL